MAIDQGTTGRTLTQTPFFSCNPDGDALFAVREGIPALDALQMTQCFLGASIDIATTVGDQNEGCSAWGLVYLLQMSKASLDAAVEVIQGGEAVNKAARQGGAL